MPDAVGNSRMTTSPPFMVAIAALAVLLVFIVLQLVALLWPRSLVTMTGGITCSGYFTSSALKTTSYRSAILVMQAVQHRLCWLLVIMRAHKQESRFPCRF